MTKETHRNQEHFRTIMEALSYPGKILEFKPFEEYRGKLFNQTIEIGLTLLDGEVSLNILGDDKVSFEEIAIRTNTSGKPIEEADYIIIPLENYNQIEDSLKKIKIGSLINPHTSGTCIIEVDEISNQGNIVLTGPGIKEANILFLKSPEWLEVRNLINSNFPLGIDILLIDKNGSLVGLPRTTNVKVGE